jgi:hypothetical protein
MEFEISGEQYYILWKKKAPIKPGLFLRGGTDDYLRCAINLSVSVSSALLNFSLKYSV